jgi:hypothetical protein
VGDGGGPSCLHCTRSERLGTGRRRKWYRWGAPAVEKHEKLTPCAVMFEALELVAPRCNGAEWHCRIGPGPLRTGSRGRAKGDEAPFRQQLNGERLGGQLPACACPGATCRSVRPDYGDRNFLRSGGCDFGPWTAYQPSSPPKAAAAAPADCAPYIIFQPPEFSLFQHSSFPSPLQHL